MVSVLRHRGRSLVPLAGLVVLLAACAPTTPTGGSSPTAEPAPSSSAPSASSSSSSQPSGPSSSASASASGGGVSTCATDQLRLGVTDAAGGGAAGSSYLLLEFTNTGDAACTMTGWPGVSLVGDGNGTQLGAAAARVQAGERRTVELAPGAKTTALLRVTEAGNYSADQCDPATADGFRIYPPNQTAAAYVARKTPACKASGVNLLSIAPIGTSG